jgi:phosphatidylglycerophosphate synthase
VGALLVHMVGVRIYPRPTWAGKAATFFQVLTVLSGLLTRYFHFPLAPTAVMWLAAGFTVVSGLQYIVQGMRFLNTTNAAEREEHESLLR